MGGIFDDIGAAEAGRNLKPKKAGEQPRGIVVKAPAKEEAVNDAEAGAVIEEDAAEEASTASPEANETPEKPEKKAKRGRPARRAKPAQRTRESHYLGVTVPAGVYRELKMEVARRLMEDEGDAHPSLGGVALEFIEEGLKKRRAKK